MPELYPLRFEPILRRYLWGSRRLESLGKQLGPGNDYAESWEIVDRTDDQSIVLGGELAGMSLGEIVRQFNLQLLGRHAGFETFPLLFKFLDANKRLSIQVHPDDARAALRTPPDLGKTEAWVILDTRPESFIYAGLRTGVDRKTLSDATESHTVELCCERIQPRVGDCFFLPPGIVHAIGRGLLVAEIQQASDVTYRLYDYDRRGPDGQPRTLHLEEALECIDYQHGPVIASRPQPTTNPAAERLVECDKFVLERIQFSGSQHVGGDNRCHILAVVGGSVSIAGDPLNTPLATGGVALVPACLGSIELQATEPAIVLDAYLP